MKQIFIIESHPVMRASYAFLINRQDDMQVCGVASTHDAVDARIEETEPDLIVLNLTHDGVAVTPIERLARTYPETPLLVVSAYDRERFAEDVREAGAKKYLRRDRVPIEIAPCIRHLIHGYRARPLSVQAGANG